MKRKLFLIVIGVCLSLAGCGNKGTDEKTVETVDNAEEIVAVEETETEEDVIEEEETEDEIGYIIEEAEVEEPEEEVEEFEFTLEYVNKNFKEMMYFYQENFTDMTEETGSEAERWLRSEIVECMINNCARCYKEIDDFNITTKDGFQITYEFEGKDNTEILLFKRILFQNFMIEKFEKGNNDFTLIDYISNTNYNDIINDDYIEKFLSEEFFYNTRYRNLPIIFDYYMSNSIDPIAISIEEDPIDDGNNFYDLNGVQNIYEVVFEPGFNDKEYYYAVYDENGHYMD